MMRSMSLAELQQPLSAQLLGEDRSFSRVTTDSRSLAAGDLFVALRGETFDGHDYVVAAQQAGAAGAVVSRAQDAQIAQLLVADTQRALGYIGAHNRQLYQGPLVAITGSSGKTTAKTLVSSVLAQRGPTLATEGNFNNEIGVPLTLLRLSPEHEFAVVEMGAAKRGDIAWLCQLGRPTVALLLNAMPAHLEGFGSLEGIVQTKGEIFDGLDAEGFAIINADQPWAAEWRTRAGEATVIDFGLQQPAAVTASEICARGVNGMSFNLHTPVGDSAVQLALPGLHNVANALAATAVGLACGLQLEEICAGLACARPVAGRLAASRSPAGATVVDDCYNANPGSVRAAIDLLAACEGRRILVLGAMRELGERSAALHAEVGSYAAQAGIDELWGVGLELEAAVAAFGENGRWFADCETAIGELPGRFDSNDTVLVKGSRGARMERVLQALLAGER
jgi:UDP-N-acetylmuramoyl-tripeptide--D-alanyl-D-alanine ligase